MIILAKLKNTYLKILYINSIIYILSIIRLLYNNIY